MRDVDVDDVLGLRRGPDEGSLIGHVSAPARGGAPRLPPPCPDDIWPAWRGAFILGAVLPC
jgi:hypothetical protein